MKQPYLSDYVKRFVKRSCSVTAFFAAIWLVYVTLFGRGGFSDIDDPLAHMLERFMFGLVFSIQVAIGAGVVLGGAIGLLAYFIDLRRCKAQVKTSQGRNEEPKTAR